MYLYMNIVTLILRLIYDNEKKNTEREERERVKVTDGKDKLHPYDIFLFSFLRKIVRSESLLFSLRLMELTLELFSQI